MPTYAEVKSYVADWINRADLSAQIGLFVNMGLRRVENDPKHNFKYMRTHSTGTLNDGDYTLAYPARYKSTQALFVQDLNSEYRRLRVSSIENALSTYPDLVFDKEFPYFFAPDDANSQVLLRPTIDNTYNYQWYYHQYSPELVADGDTNWLLDNQWEIIGYAAMMEAALFMRDMEGAAAYNSAFEERRQKLVDTQILQDIDGSELSVTSDYVV